MDLGPTKKMEMICTAELYPRSESTCRNEISVVLLEMVVIMKDIKTPILGTEGANEKIILKYVKPKLHLKNGILGGNNSFNQCTLFLQHAREEALNPLCLDFGKSSGPVSPDILKSEESRVCRDL